MVELSSDLKSIKCLNCRAFWADTQLKQCPNCASEAVESTGIQVVENTTLICELPIQYADNKSKVIPAGQNYTMAFHPDQPAIYYDPVGKEWKEVL